MPVCRKCQKEWPEGMTACPDDGWSFTMDVDATYHPAPVRQPSQALDAMDDPTALAPAARAPASQAMGAMGAMMTAAPMLDEPPPSSDLIAGALVGEYRVEKKIGEGGMGAVYSAMHPMIGKRAAIKVISSALGTDASAVNRFIQEARSVNQIGHPNIVDVFAFGELPDGRNYFVMEYLQGESLADRLGRIAMPLGEAIEILDQVADALEAAHEKQIVHRDLKPDNVYLAAVRGGRTMVKLLDFGIAKLSAPDGPGSGGVQKTRTGMMMGTPGYLSPEQARGKNVDHRTDVYALGCMTFEIVCGRLPFVADNAMDIVLMHMTAPPVRASAIWPEIPAQLDDLIARMLEKEASARPSLVEVRAVFSELVTSGLVTLNNGRGVAFGSGISRLQTPAGGTPRPATYSALAVGTQPSGERPPTQPPAAVATTVSPAEAPKKKTGLIIAALAGVVVLGSAGAFFAMQGGKNDKEAVAAPTTPQPPPVVETPKPAVVETPKAPVVETPKPAPSTIEIAINVDKALVAVDGKAVEVKGKKATTSVDAEGPHVVTVDAVGRDTFETTVTTKAGETSKVDANLQRPKAGAKVVKKQPAGAKTGTTATTATTATTGTKPTGTKPAGTDAKKDDGKKGPDTSKDAPIDPF